MAETKPRLTHYIQYGLARGLIFIARLLPYRLRVPAFGWLVSRVIAPVIGWNRRVRDNLAMIYPQMDPVEVRRIMHGVTDNAGRVLIETWSAEEFVAHNRDAKLSGPGLAAFEKARSDCRPVLLVNGHFANYMAVPVALTGRGQSIGGIYKPMTNPVFNDFYVAAIRKFMDQLFATDRKGITHLVRFLRGGNTVGILLDVHRASGTPAPFLGKPAMTSTSAAEWSKRYDALLVPVFAIRQPDGLSFEIVFDDPVPNDGNVIEITKALTDSLSRQVEKRPEQWFWIHRRWKFVPEG